jgi:hypothetical protein
MFAIFRRQVFRDMLKWPFSFSGLCPCPGVRFYKCILFESKNLPGLRICLERTRLDVISCFFLV